MKISNAFTLQEVEDILERYENHKFKDEIKYFVNEENETSMKYDEPGFFVDKFIVGVHNRHTHFSIEELKLYLKENKDA